MNLAALIGSVVSVVDEDTGVTVEMRVAGRDGRKETLRVAVEGAMAASCATYLRPGDRIAVEGVVQAGAARTAEVLAERVQYLTTRRPEV
jgi:single-stranded DNA-binding protein